VDPYPFSNLDIEGTQSITAAATVVFYISDVLGPIVDLDRYKKNVVHVSRVDGLIEMPDELPADKYEVYCPVLCFAECATCVRPFVQHSHSRIVPRYGL
jgi:hypothetical protein